MQGKLTTAPWSEYHQRNFGRSPLPSSSSPTILQSVRLVRPKQELSNSVRMTEIGQSVYELCECKEKVGWVRAILRFYRPCHLTLRHGYVTEGQFAWHLTVYPETLSLPPTVVEQGPKYAPMAACQTITIRRLNEVFRSQIGTNIMYSCTSGWTVR